MMSSILMTRADSARAAQGTSGFTIASFGGVPGLGAYDGTAATPGAVPIAPVQLPANVFRLGHGALSIATLNTVPALPYAMAATGFCQLIIGGQVYSTDDASPLFTISGTSVAWLPNAPNGFPLEPGTPVTYVVTY